jgi:hypothetical protein
MRVVPVPPDAPLVIDPGDNRSDLNSKRDSAAVSEGEALNTIMNVRGARSSPGRVVGRVSPAVRIAAAMATNARRLIGTLTRLDQLFPSTGDDTYQLWDGPPKMRRVDRLPAGWAVAPTFVSDGQAFGETIWPNQTTWNEMDITYDIFVTCFGPRQGPHGKRAEAVVHAELDIYVEKGTWMLQFNINEPPFRAMVELDKRIPRSPAQAKRGGAA